MSNQKYQNAIDAAYQRWETKQKARKPKVIEARYCQTNAIGITGLIDITDDGGRAFSSPPTDGQMGSDQETASQFLWLSPHKERLYSTPPVPTVFACCRVHLRAEHYVNPGLLDTPVANTKWLPKLATASAAEYKRYIAEDVDLEMRRDIRLFFSFYEPKSLSSLRYLFSAFAISAQLYRHRLTHGLGHGCSHLHVIDKSWWLSRLVKWLLRIPSNPYPWVDELIASRQGVESGDSVSAGNGQVSG